jgi:hypothetical protein
MDSVHNILASTPIGVTWQCVIYEYGIPHDTTMKEVGTWLLLTGPTIHRQKHHDKILKEPLDGRTKASTGRQGWPLIQ